MKGKHFALAGLISVLLTLVIAPTSTQQGVSDYDPWYDINDDGIIDIEDIASVAIKFGATGTPINKTELLLELLEKIESLNNTIIELETTINYLNTTVVYLNETVVYLNSTGLGAPDHDSGWKNLPQWPPVQINHNLGTTDIIVYMFGKDSYGQTHQINYGGDAWDSSNNGGAFWSTISPNSIWVYNYIRGAFDDPWVQVRVLVWEIP